MQCAAGRIWRMAWGSVQPAEVGRWQFLLHPLPSLTELEAKKKRVKHKSIPVPAEGCDGNRKGSQNYWVFGLLYSVKPSWRDMSGAAPYIQQPNSESFVRSSGDLIFESILGDQISWLEIFVGFSSPFGKILERHLKIDHCEFHVISSSAFLQSSHHSLLHNQASWKNVFTIYSPGEGKTFPVLN
jgi:hypothetical protein